MPIEKKVEHFEAFLAKLDGAMRRLVRRFQGNGYSWFDEEDLLQELRQHLWQRFRQGDFEDKPTSYIITSCRFQLQNYLRKQRRAPETLSLDAPINGSGSSLLEVIEPYAPSEETLDARILINEIRNNGLTRREKEVFEELLTGRTTREIGSRIGISHVRVVHIRAQIVAKYRCKLDSG